MAGGIVVYLDKFGVDASSDRFQPLMDKDDGLAV